MSTRKLPPRQYWMAWEEEFLRRNYADSLTVDLARALGTSIDRVLRKAHAMGLHKSRETIAETARERSLRPDHGGRKTAFKPGLQPWNKGKHFDSGGRSVETRFRPGQKPHTWKPVGSLRVVKNKNGGPELQRKVNDLPGNTSVRWKPVARLVWEAAHGPVPEDYIVVFKPGRRTTEIELITLDALECITRQELMHRNTIHHYPKELVHIHQLRGVLQRAINQQARKARTSNQEPTP